MCFSATTSFSAAAILASVGAVSTYISRSKPSLPHASIPLLFALQQAAEGIVWLTQSSPPPQTLHYLAGYIFIIFAFVFWPIWIPFSLWLMEKSPIRKKILFLLILNGALLSLSSTIAMLFFPLHIGLDSNHLMYYTDINSLYLKNTHLIFYSFSTVLPFFIVASKSAKTISLLLLTSLVLSYVYAYFSFISVWCFFAAVISAMMLLVIME